MFETEAEEYIKKDGTETEQMLNNITLSLTNRQAFVLKNAFKQTFKDAATFGYSKGKQEAREVIEGLMRFCRCFAQHHTEDIRYKDAEQFLQEDADGN